MEREPYHLPTESVRGEMPQCDVRFFRHIDPTLPPLSDDELMTLMCEMNTWSLWHKLGWLEAARHYLEERGIDTTKSSSSGC
jgi:hypothetical protein